MSPLPPFKLGATIVVNDRSPGSPVVGVFEGSLADRIKIKPGDVLYRINGKPLETEGDVAAFLSEDSAAARVTFWQSATGKYRDVRVVQTYSVATDEILQQVVRDEEYTSLESVP